MLESIRLALQIFPKSFINCNNEIILIPKFNVYVCLDDVETDDDFKVELCEWFSRDCCCALMYSRRKELERYWQDNTNAFNQICKTNFTVEQMQFIYLYLGNGIKHELTKEFVKSGFDLSIIEKYLQEREQKQGLIGDSEMHVDVEVKLCEYEQAEDDGLLVRLPCKAGDMIYMPTRYFVSEFGISSFQICMNNNVLLHTKLIKGIIIRGEVFNADEIGKTIFLTREEAERALKEAQENA